jgi:molybdate/tungstate transport system substrate-binding protein
MEAERKVKRAHLALILITILLISLTAVFLFIYYGYSGEKTKLKIYCAASLMFPLARCEESFEKIYPDVDVEVEGHGSIQVIRHVTELGYKADLLMVADYSLIPVMMYNTTMPDTNQSFANWYLRFASNSIVLAYSEHSKYSAEINSTNWYSILARTDVKFGFPNPIIDALGYRALITLQLAEIYYGNNHIFHDLVTDNFDPPITSVPSDSDYIIIVPEVQQPTGDKVFLRASSIQLIPLLESGSIDYCFLYLSNAKQYGFSFLELPAEVNLGSTEYQNTYSRVQVRFEHQRFASIGLNREGTTIYYGLTIPKNALHTELALQFANFLFGQEGREIFTSAWHPLLQPCYTDNFNFLPKELRAFGEQETPGS